MAKLPHSDQDTIAAIATAPGRAGISVIRISGNQALTIAQTLTAKPLKPRYATLAELRNQNGKLLDEAIVIYYPAPHSFTGEHVVELQGHGGHVLINRLLQEVVRLGARIAAPGEFSQRAFLNDKIDLTQAEAIADLIDAGSEAAADNALMSLQGGFKKHIEQLLQQIIEIRVYVEAAIDFPEEEIDFLSDGKVEQALEAIIEQLISTENKAQQGALLKEGIRVVIAGRPNAGKSSLLNALSERESAIVTDIAGTTRDVLHETIQIDGLPIQITDTAGIRDTEDPVEKIGVARAKQELEKAQVILVLLDSKLLSISEGNLEQVCDQELQHLGLTELASDKLCFIVNKIDLTTLPEGRLSKQRHVFALSAKTETGLSTLKTFLKEKAGYQQAQEGLFTARARHLNALARAKESVLQALQQLRLYNAGELVAEDLRSAQEQLGEITGEFSNDDLLGEIFSSFCIGK